MRRQIKQTGQKLGSAKKLERDENILKYKETDPEKEKEYKDNENQLKNFEKCTNT